MRERKRERGERERDFTSGNYGTYSLPVVRKVDPQRKFPRQSRC